MALEGANIMGQAQVYNQTQNAVNTYAKIMAQQQAKLAAEQKALQEDLSKVKLDGIRQKDIPEFTAKYNEAKETFAKLNAARNAEEKIRLRREYDTKVLEAKEIAADSREMAKRYASFDNIIIDPNKRDMWTDDAVQRYQLSKDLPRNDPRFIRDLTTLERQVDLSKIISELDKIDSELLKSEMPTMVETKGKQGGRDGVFVTQQRVLTPEKQTLAYAAEFDLNPNFRLAVKKLFPQFSDLSNTELKAAAIPELVKQRPKSIFDKTDFKPTGMTEYQRRSLAFREAGEGGAGSPNSYNVESDTWLLTKPKKFDEYDMPVSGSEKKSIRMIKSVGFDSDYFPLVDTKAFDVDRQKADATVSGNFIVGKLAYVPIKGGGVDLRAVVVNSEGDKFVVKPDALPIGIRRGKNFKAAVKALGSPPAKQQTSNTNQGKKYSETEEQGISAVMNANKVSRQEAINALVKAGKLSK